MADRPDLTALIGSRICHDLISPIGAIGNGVELLMMSGAGQTPEVALIAESVASANARIRFFRVAFGAAGAEQRMARAEVTGILGDLMRGTRLSVAWNGPTEMARRQVKLVFLAIQCLESAMAFGGKIAVEGGETRWTLTGHATRMKIDPAIWEVLAHPSLRTDISPAQVHFALLAEEVARIRRRITTELRETEVRLSF